MAVIKNGVQHGRRMLSTKKRRSSRSTRSTRRRCLRASSHLGPRLGGFIGPMSRPAL